MKLSDIKLNPANPRSITEVKFKKLVQSLKESTKFLEARPIVIKDGVVFGGNMRLRALQELGYKEIPDEWIKDVSGWTAEDIHKFIVVDNIAYGDNDWDLLSEQYEKEELEAWGMDVDKWVDNEVVEDEVPEVTDNPVSKLGEVYQLGRHRLMCGDSTVKSDVEKLMEGKKADMLLTDPPYGIGISSNPVRQKHEKSNWDDNPVSKEQIDFMLTQSDKCVIWGGNYFELPPSKGYLIWDKKQPEDFSLAMCEMAWSSVDKPAKIYRESVTSYSKDHPTQKPVGLMAWCMGIYEAGDNILDVYLGSGSTLIACEQTNRICYGMEISEAYCDVIRKRYAKFIGKEDEWETLTPRIQS